MRGAWRFAIREQRGGGTTFRRGGLSHIERRAKVPSSDVDLAVSGPLAEILRRDPRDRHLARRHPMLKRYGERALEESASRARRARIGTATGIAAVGLSPNI